MPTPESITPPGPAGPEDDFRDHIATADAEGGAVDLSAQGQRQLLRWRTWFSWLLLVIMFAGPFITIHGNPLLLMNISSASSSCSARFSGRRT